MFNVLFEGLAFMMVGFVGWIALSVLCTIWLFISVDSTRYIQAGACLALYLILGINHEALVPILNSPYKLFLGIFAYLIIGAIWSIVKWYIYLHKDLKRFLLEDKSGRARTQDNESVLVLEGDSRVKRILLHEFNGGKCRCVAPSSERDYLRGDPFEIVDHSSWEHVLKEHDEIKDYARWNGQFNKEKILTWILYWPISMWWSLIDDFIKNFAKKIQYLLRGVYDRIQDHVYAKMKKDLGK